MKIVLNRDYGGFGLSDEALAKISKIDRKWDYLWNEKNRANPELVKVVEELGEKANGGYANLVIKEIPDETTDWEIEEYDGYESLVYVVNGQIYRI